MSQKIKIQLVDDHDLVRTGFRHILEDFARFEVVSECSNGEQAINDYVKFQPDVVLMDISMQGMNGLDATRHILNKDAAAKVIILSMQGREAAVRSLEAGAKGFLSKSSAAAEVLTAIQSVLKGHAYIDRETAQQIALYQLNGSTDNPLKVLSVREFEVFEHLAHGLSIEDIASRCFLSPKTVRSHKSHIMQKLELRNTIDFVRMAIQTGVIALNDRE